MRALSTVLFTAVGLLAVAQTCTTTPVGGAESQLAYEFVCDRSTDGGTVVAVQPDNALGAMPLSRVAADGTVAWSRRINCTNPIFQLIPTAISALDDGGAVIIGDLTSYYWWVPPYSFFIRVDGSGQPVVAKIIGRDTGNDGQVGSWSHICRTQDGAFVLSGSSEGYGSSGTTPILKLDADANEIWSKRYEPDANGTTYQIGEESGLVEDPNGDLVLFIRVGAYQSQGYHWMIRTDASGAPIATYRYDTPWTVYSACGTSDGGYIVGGSTASGNDTPCLWKLDHDGVPQWSNVMAPGVDPYNSRISSIAEMTDGSLIATPKWGNNVSLLHFSNAGALLEAMYAPGAYDVSKIAGIGQDSVSYVYCSINDNGNPTVMHATDLANGTCALNPASTTVSQGVPSWTIVSDPVPFHATSPYKMWDLSIGPLADLTGLDLRSHVATGCPRPGFPYYTSASVRNYGGDPSGVVDVTLTLDPGLVLYSFYPDNPVSTAGNVVTWSMPSLPAFGGYDFHVAGTVPVGTPLGTTLNTTFTASQPSPELDLVNNTASFSDIVTGSYDPNDKLVSPRDFYHIENDSVLNYTIRFQNTGTAEAINVVVVDTLPMDVDTRTFEMGVASHPYTYTLTGNGILTFTFENINLPDSNTNEPLSHGLVNFKIKPILPLQLGQEITNAADIYFDFNPPVHTPAATVVVTDETGVRPLVMPAQLVVYPVPTKNSLMAVLPEGFKPVQAFAIGVDGRRLPMVLPPSSAGQVQFATQHLPVGAYVLTLRAQDGKRLSARFVKE